MSRAEQIISRTLRTILSDLADGDAIADSEAFRGVLAGLEYFLPDVVGEQHPEWKREGLDGIIPVVARKAADHEIELSGVCILIADQTLAPYHLYLQVDPVRDEVAWLECCIGEAGEGGMKRTPYRSLHTLTKRLRVLGGDTGGINWAYRVEFGSRRP